MKRQPFVNFLLAGVSLTEFGLKIPSPFASLELANSEISSFTSWTLNCVVGGDSSRKINVAAFEALLYSAAQEASNYKNASGIPVSFMFGWLDDHGSVEEYLSYQGFTLQFDVKTSGQYISYTIKGYASVAMQASIPALRIPALSGFVQPSAVVEALAKACKATSYYLLDIDHNDAPTYISHNALTTSFNNYIRGSYGVSDEYHEFPGLLKLSKSYNATRFAAGLVPGARSLNNLLKTLTVSGVKSFLRSSLSDNTPQCSSFSYWIDEPTMTRPGVIHYKSNSGGFTSHSADTLEYGTANTNILSLSGSYNGVAYNMSDLRFSQLGFAVDASGNAIVEGASVVNSWSASLAGVYQTANIINDLNAIATQFSGDFSVQIPGTVKKYSIAQPVSLLVMAGNTVSPVTGIYNVMSVGQSISNQFITTLKLQRLVMSTANQVATSQGILISGSANYARASMSTTSNVKSPYKVDFGQIYPDFTYMYDTQRI